MIEYTLTDIAEMKQLCKEFEIDTEKQSIGKLKSKVVDLINYYNRILNIINQEISYDFEITESQFVLPFLGSLADKLTKKTLE